MNDVGGLLTRRFAAGPATFVVRCPSTPVLEAVEQLFVDLSDGSDTTVDSEIVLFEEADGSVRMHAAGRDTGSLSPNGALATMVTSVSRLALDTDPDRLHLHCGALSLGGRGVLISAPSGTGKTTLAAALALHGWSYVSDETVALDVGSPVATGFPKPMLFKLGGGGLVPELSSARVSLDPDDDRWWLVPASAVPARIATALEPSVIVILHRAYDGSVDAPPLPTPLHPADAVVALMGQTMDAGRFGPDAASVLARIAAQCLCVALPVGPLDATVSVLEALIRATPERLKVHELVAPPVIGVDGWQVSASVRSTQIGERVVVHDTSGGAIVALDEAGTGLWRALHGDPPQWWQADGMWTPSAESFLEQLAAHGLIAHITEKESTSP